MSPQREWKERLVIWISWHLPRSIVYWCAIRLMKHATTGKYSGTIVPSLKILDALERWGS